MARKTARKGQVALETAFVVLFVIVAIGGIMIDLVEYTSDIDKVATARAKVQSYALDRSVGQGVFTYLVRIDLLNPPATDIYRVFIRTEDCSGVSGDITTLIGSADTVCTDNIYEY